MRIAFDASFIKEQENLTDEGTVAYLSENPYAQYLVGLKAFRKEPLFDSSMMVHFRKRFTPELLQRVNELMYERAHPAEEYKPDDKEHNIRLSGPKLGRPRKDETEESRSQAYQDSCDRNMVENRNGIGKRRYGLDLIMAYLAETGKTETAFIILAMNVAHLLRFPFSSFLAHAEDRKMVWKIGWDRTSSCMKEREKKNRLFQQALNIRESYFIY